MKQQTKHPKGLFVLALANLGERFGYYTMLAILTLYMQAKFGLSSGTTSMIYGTFLALVYFLPLIGGVIADKLWGFGKTILVGITIMFGGYLLLAVPTDNGTTGLAIMYISLLLISAGTGLFKGNLQALVGKLYDDPRYSSKRDIAFSIFYMFINIGAFFAPSMANTINKVVLQKENFYYDANIPKNYVALNNKVVDKGDFMAAFLKEHSKYRDISTAAPDKREELEKEMSAALNKSKKKQGVMFEEDQRQALFNLKSAGLVQLTVAGIISNPDMELSKSDYTLLESRVPGEQGRKNEIIDRINAIPESALSTYFQENGQNKVFAERFGAEYVNKSLSSSYNLSFMVACVSLVFSIIIFLVFKKTWKHADIVIRRKKDIPTDSKEEASAIPQMSKAEVRERLIALFLVFFVVIFFWMAFHQNGLCMTFFARDYTQSNITAAHNILFSLIPLLGMIAFLYGVYALTFGLFGGKKSPKTGIGLMIVGLAVLAGYYFIEVSGVANELVKITPQIFMQFNPFFIIVLTPLVVGIFTYLNNRGKEPSAPRKIGIGMFLAALGFVLLMLASFGLPAPSSLNGTSEVLVSPNWLIGTYLILTVAELFLSPMGLSFVAKVAPPQYSGIMQGGWLAATAIGNMLVGVMGTFWDKLSLVSFWAVLVVCCILSAIFIFSVMKKLERVTQD